MRIVTLLPGCLADETASHQVRESLRPALARASAVARMPGGSGVERLHAVPLVELFTALDQLHFGGRPPAEVHLPASQPPARP